VFHHLRDDLPVLHYRRGRGGKPEDIHGHTLLELLWTGIPLVLFLTMFYYGWTNYRYLREVPRDGHGDSGYGSAVGVVVYLSQRPANQRAVCRPRRPVRLDLKSLDVLHGFYVPAFRVKADVVPGKNNYTWFQAEQLGDFDIECTVMCGVNHSYMLSKVRVIPEADFSAWYFGESADAPVLSQTGVTGEPDPAHGERIFKLKGCVACHTTDGSKFGGSDLEGTLRQPGHCARRRQGSHIDCRRGLPRALHSSPSQGSGEGFAPQMPKADLSDNDVADLVAYIKSLH